MKKRVHVKPVTSKTEVFGWIVLELNIISNFFDDWKRYGLQVALDNLRTLLFDT